jgi:hypothetical protein
VTLPPIRRWAHLPQGRLTVTLSDIS